MVYTRKLLRISTIILPTLLIALCSCLDSNTDNAAPSGTKSKPTIKQTDWSKGVVKVSDASLIGSIVRSIAISPDGKLIAIGQKNGDVKFWTCPQLDEKASLMGHTELVNDLVFLPDGKKLAAVSSDGQAIIWDLATGQQLKNYSLSDHVSDKEASYGLWCVAASPNGRQVLIGGYRDHIAFASTWDVVSNKIEHSSEYKGFTFDVSYHPDGNYYIAAGSGDNAIVYEVPGWNEVLVIKHSNWILQAKFSPSGELIATTSMDGTAKLWKFPSGDLVATMTDFAHEMGPLALDFSPDGKYIAISDRDVITMWTVPDGNNVKAVSDTGITAERVLFSPNGKYLITAKYNKIEIWESE
jgi:WD40 repeat protein